MISLILASLLGLIVVGQPASGVMVATSGATAIGTAARGYSMARALRAPAVEPALVPDASTISAQVTPSTSMQWTEPPEMAIDPNSHYTAVILTDKGDIVVDLFADEAPLTVNNFVFLARAGFYDGVRFHRVIKNFMIQTGDPLGTGTGGPGYRFADEPVTRPYSKGTVAMANAGPNTNGSQFFIVQGDDVGLPPAYTIFGQVVDGLDVVDAIASVPVGRAANSGESSAPQEEVRVLGVAISEN